MKILDRYLLREFLLPFGFCLLIFILLYWVIDIFSHLDDFIKNHVPLSTLAQYYLAGIPVVLVQSSPLASLIGAVTCLGRLNKSNELIILRSSGLSWIRISFPIVATGIAITVLTLFLNDSLIPQAMFVTQTIKEENLEKNPSVPQTIVEDVALYGTKNRMFYAKRYDPNQKTLYDLIIFIDDERHHPMAKISAERAEWIVKNKWKLFSCVAYQLGPQDEIVEKPIYYEERTMDLDESPQNFQGKELQIGFMAYQQLESYIERIAVAGENVTRRLLVELYSRVSFPFANLVLILIGIPFAVLPFQTKGGIWAGIGFCVVVSILFYGTYSLFIAFGKAGFLPPWLSAWGANLLFAGTGVVILWKL